MNALDRHINEINRLYEELGVTRSRNRRFFLKKRIKELEDDLLEYCAWRKLNYANICKRIFK